MISVMYLEHESVVSKMMMNGDSGMCHSTVWKMAVYHMIPSAQYEKTCSAPEGIPQQHSATITSGIAGRANPNMNYDRG